MPDPAVLIATKPLTTEELLLTVLGQLVIIIIAARVFAWLFRLLKQPAVVGEIAAGLILGPSCFGFFFPEWSQVVFNPAVAETFKILSELGLVLLLFLVGLEFDFGHLRWHGRAALAISLVGIAVPFALGAGLAPFIYQYLEPVVIKSTSVAPVAATNAPAAFWGFLLFLGVSMSITAIPVLARMMLELGITRTRIGTITITAAAVDDACGWILLATIASVVRAEFDMVATLKMILATLGFFLFMVFVTRPLMKRFVRWAVARGQGELDVFSLAVVFVVLLTSAMATHVIGIFAIFGAFVLGTVLADEIEFRDLMSRQLRNFLLVFFLPVFFTYTGLHTNIGTLASPLHWVIFGGVMACAIAGKLGGCTLAARWGGLNWRESLCIGALMNTRGLMELIVANLGRELGVIPESVYCMLVLMALITTCMATPLVLAFMRGTELEGCIRASGFLRSAFSLGTSPAAESRER